MTGGIGTEVRIIYVGWLVIVKETNEGKLTPGNSLVISHILLSSSHTPADGPQIFPPSGYKPHGSGGLGLEAAVND